MSSTAVRVSFCAAIIPLLLFAIPVMAGQASITINPGTLGDALDAYSKATGTRIVCSKELTEGKNSSGAQNTSPDDALQQILQGTGLTFQMPDNNTAVLKKKKSTEKHPVSEQQENKKEESKIQQARREIKLDELIVSAQKTEENIQDVPISMSVFDAVTIEDRMIDTVEDIAKYTPGLEILGLSAVKSAPSIRGLYSNYASKSSTAALYVDGIPVTDGTGFDQTLMDIQRIEVLKGPQGTLYGKNAEVGVINVITKKPDNETRGKIKGILGSDNKRELAFNVSAPLVKDKFYISIAGKHYEKDGFLYNTSKNKIEDDREHNYGKVNLRWTPTDNLELSLISSKIKYNNGANTSGLTTDREVSSDLDTFNKSEVMLNALNIKYSFNDKFSLTSVTAQRNYTEFLANDFDYLDDDSKKFHILSDSTYHTLSQELKLNYENKKIKVVSGIFLENSDVDMDKDRDAAWGFKKTLENTDTDTIGVFSHLTYDITEKLSVLGGLRYDSIEKHYEDPTQTIDDDESEISPKIGATYDLKEDVMLYSTISKGYRAGGFNVAAPDGYPKTFGKESLYSYEVGLKGSFLNGRLTYDMAVYYMDITDMQVVVQLNGGTNNIKTNAAKATSMGVESSLQFRITDSLNLFAGVSYNDTSFDEYNDGSQDLSGNKTAYAPEYNFNIGVLYRAINGFYAGADLTGYGEMYLDRTNEYKRGAFELVNTKIGYEQEGYDIYLYANNLFDEKYDTVDVFDVGYSTPREIGVQLTYRF